MIRVIGGHDHSTSVNSDREHPRSQRRLTVYVAIEPQGGVDRARSEFIDQVLRRRGLGDLIGKGRLA
jgi:hypothetical protein